WSNFFDGIACFAADRPLAIERLTESVDDTAQQPFANGHLKQLASGANLLALANFAPVAENDGPDLGFFEVERQADDAGAKINHFVQHRVAEAFDLGDTVTNFANGADIL